MIPTFGTVDLSLSYRAPTRQNALLNLSVSNLLCCTSEGVTYAAPAAVAGQSAGPVRPRS